MDDQFLGRRLRAERERRRITLESIAANTKIPAPLLRGLERDDVSQWPRGIFRRSFVKSYAAAIGLDPDGTLQEFLERFPDPEATRSGRPAGDPEIRPRRVAKPVLRLTLADEPHVFMAGAVLRGARPRLAAAACDIGAPAAIAGLAYLLVGAFWAPLALACLCYFAVGVVVLGNTPGVTLCAPGTRVPPPTDAQRSDDVTSLPMLGESLSR